jgi:hypothetical protein
MASATYGETGRIDPWRLKPARVRTRHVPPTRSPSPISKNIEPTVPSLQLGGKERWSSDWKSWHAVSKASNNEIELDGESK